MKKTIVAMAMFLVVSLNPNYSLARDFPLPTKTLTPPRDALQENKKINCNATPNFSSSGIIKNYECEIVIGGIDGYKLYPGSSVENLEQCDVLCKALTNICTK